VSVRYDASIVSDVTTCSCSNSCEEQLDGCLLRVCLTGARSIKAESAKQQTTGLS